MEMQEHRETQIRRWFSMWLDKADSLFCAPRGAE